MACSISANLTRDCVYALAGIQKLWLGNYDEFTFQKDSDSVVTGITASSGATFYVYDANIDSASATAELQVAAGNRKYFNQTVTFSIDSDTVEAKNQLESLGLARTVAIVETKSGIKSIYGIDGGLNATVLTFGTGAAAGDQSGWSATLTGVGKEVRSLLDPTATIPV